MNTVNQKIALYNANKRGLKLSLESCIEHLKGECDEFLAGINIKPEVIEAFPEDCDDYLFINMYRDIIKDSKIDELADLAIIPMTIAEIMGVDVAKIVRMKQRFNYHREDEELI